VASDTAFRRSVFVNCPFDEDYRPIFDAILFAIMLLGYTPRCAREAEHSGEARIAKIERIIAECKYGIHDISEVRLDPVNHLSRFNMPLELGMFMGCKGFGGPTQAKKTCLILDAESYRYQKFISDIAGQDIRAHANQPSEAIMAVRDWLVTVSRRKRLPGGTAVVKHYGSFISELPKLCRRLKLDRGALTFVDLTDVIRDWLSTSRNAEVISLVPKPRRSQT